MANKIISKLDFDTKLCILEYLLPEEIVNTKNILSFQTCLYNDDLMIDFQDHLGYEYIQVKESFTLSQLVNLITKTNWNVLVKVDGKVGYECDDDTTKAIYELSNLTPDINRKVKIIITRNYFKYAIPSTLKFPIFNAVFIEIKDEADGNCFELIPDLDYLSANIYNENLEEIEQIDFIAGDSLISCMPCCALKAIKPTPILTIFDFKFYTSAYKYMKSNIIFRKRKAESQIISHHFLLMELNRNLSTQEDYDKLSPMYQIQSCENELNKNTNIAHVDIMFKLITNNLFIVAPQDSIESAEFNCDAYTYTATGQEMWNHNHSKFTGVYLFPISKTVNDEAIFYRCYNGGNPNHFYNFTTGICFNSINSCSIKIIFSKSYINNHTKPTKFKIFSETLNLMSHRQGFIAVHYNIN